MNPPEKTTETGTHTGLPMMTIFSVRQSGDRAVAHALHFDLVATAPTAKEALKKLSAAVKHHFEFGLKRGLAHSDILLDAPQECWDKIKDAPFSLGEEIEIDHLRIQTMTQTATDDSERSLTTA